jgi:hypothetical protein
MTIQCDFYTYAYLRKDGTPYYIGKGRGKRINVKHGAVPLPPKDKRIFLKRNLTEAKAVKHEIYLIFVLGRKCNGTGILRNTTKGGDGCSGYKHPDSFKERMRGENNPWHGKKSPNPIHSERMKGRNWWHNPETNECSLCHIPPTDLWILGRPPAFKKNAVSRMKTSPTQLHKKWWYNTITREEKLLISPPGEGWELGRPSHSEKLKGKVRKHR